jgi:hypothetical protein
MTDDPRTLLDLIIAKAEDLRSAGVTSLEFNGVKIALSPPVVTQPEVVESRGSSVPDEETPSDPLDDPMTFGLNGKLPGAPMRSAQD